MSETDRRLKDHLNTNQYKREGMCLEILTVQEGYTDMKPRLPKGGPDGGRDIEGLYKGRLCFGAVGFVNDATDLDQHRKQIQEKFKDDLENALKPKEEKPTPQAFVFFTNVGLTPSIIDDLQKMAYTRGLSHCEIFDRERLKIILDSNRGYAIRFRYLDIPLSDSEQKDFFSAWADGITTLIGSGIEGLSQTTRRIQFLIESQLLLDHLGIVVQFDAPIWDVCRGEFFFQASLTLRVHSSGLVGFTFGGGNDRSVESLEEWRARGAAFSRNGQYGFVFSSVVPDTEQYFPFKGAEEKQEYPNNVEARSDTIKYFRTSNSRGLLRIEQDFLYFEALREPFLFRHQPTCKLLDINGCMLIFDCSKEIADHITEIMMMGGGYELLKLNKGDLHIAEGRFDRLMLPNECEQTPDSHDWVTLRPATGSSTFTIDLMHRTPRRYDWR